MIRNAAIDVHPLRSLRAAWLLAALSALAPAQKSRPAPPPPPPSKPAAVRAPAPRPAAPPAQQSGQKTAPVYHPAAPPQPQKPPTGAGQPRTPGPNPKPLPLNDNRGLVNQWNRTPGGHRLPSDGVVAAKADGRYSVTSKRGSYEVGRDGRVTQFSNAAGSLHFYADGKLATTHVNNLTIVHDPRGGVRIERSFSGGVRLVNTPTGGFLERRRVDVLGRRYIDRNYVVNGHAYTRTYAVAMVGGVPVVRYVPPVTYSPAFLFWVAGPSWGLASFDFGWGSQPWFAGGAGYFAPSVYYPNASLWVTDYAIGATLRSNYSPDPSGAVPAPPQAPITADTKSALAAQGQDHEKSLALAAQSNQTPVDAGAPLRPETPFIVSDSLDVAVGEQHCPLTAGDIVVIAGAVPAGASQVAVRVKDSKARDCAPGSLTLLSLADLEEMHAAFLDHWDAGLAQLSAKEGISLPAGPPANPQPVPGWPAADPSVAFQLQQQQQDAVTEEKSFIKQAFPDEN